MHQISLWMSIIFYHVCHLASDNVGPTVNCFLLVSYPCNQPIIHNRSQSCLLAWRRYPFQPDLLGLPHHMGLIVWTLRGQTNQFHLDGLKQLRHEFLRLSLWKCNDWGHTPSISHTSIMGKYPHGVQISYTSCWFSENQSANTLIHRAKTPPHHLLLSAPSIIDGWNRAPFCFSLSHDSGQISQVSLIS